MSKKQCTIFQNISFNFLVLKLQVDMWFLIKTYRYTIKSGNLIAGYMYFCKETHNDKNTVQEQDC